MALPLLCDEHVPYPIVEGLRRRGLDILTVQEIGGETVAGVHIADMSTFVWKGDPLDREAYRRSATIYLPNVSVMMFSERLATDLASLIQRGELPSSW